MSFELEIPLETHEGYQYLVSFKEFPHNQIEYEIPLIDVSITLMTSKIEINSLKTLNNFIKIILDYLEKNDVIIYFYCDTAPINIRKTRKQKYSNQEFRFHLFLMMFNKQKTVDFYLQDIVINDNTNGNHYVSLISKITNKTKVEKVKSDIEKFNK